MRWFPTLRSRFARSKALRHARSRSGRLHEAVRSRSGAISASDRSLWGLENQHSLRKTLNSCFSPFLLPTLPRRSETLPERPPGRPGGAPRWPPALPESSSEPSQGVSQSHFARLRLLEPAPTGSARPSDAAPERFRPRFGASGASKWHLGSCSEHCRIVRGASAGSSEVASEVPPRSLQKPFWLDRNSRSKSLIELC